MQASLDKVAILAHHNLATTTFVAVTSQRILSASLTGAAVASWAGSSALAVRSSVYLSSCLFGFVALHAVIQNKANQPRVDVKRKPPLV